MKPEILTFNGDQYMVVPTETKTTPALLETARKNGCVGVARKSQPATWRTGADNVEDVLMAEFWLRVNRGAPLLTENLNAFALVENRRAKQAIERDRLRRP